MSNDAWRRPNSLIKLATAAKDSPSRPEAWQEAVARCRAASTLARIERAVLDGALGVDAATDAASDAWPSDYVEAFRHLGHDQTYGTETEAGLYGLFEQMSDAQLDGLANAVKGTVMEIRVRDMIQAGQVPGVGNCAEDAALAATLNQTGHDIEIVDGRGDVIETLQVKSGTWASVRGRIDEYAADGIPVAVTAETAEKAAAAGYSKAVIDTGISGNELTEQTAAIVDNLSLSHAADELVPELAVVALMAAAGLRMRSGQSVQAVSIWLTNELKQIGVVNAAGVAIQLITGMAVLRPIAVLGTRWGMARARTSTEAVVALGRAREVLSAVVSRQGKLPIRELS